MKLFHFTLICVLLLSSCKKEDEGNIAEYGNYVLTRTEIKNMIPNELKGKDSIAFVNQLIDRWVKDKVLLQNSQEILSPEEIDKIDLKVSRYKEDITISFIEEKLTENMLDTIPEAEIQSYYKTYEDSFDLKEDYLQYRYMSIPLDSALSYKKLLRNKEYTILEQKLNLYGYSHDMSPDNWITQKQFLTTDYFPAELKKHNLHTKNQIFTIEQNHNAYIFELTDYKKAGQTAPLVIVKDMIKSVLINKRKLNLLSEKKKEFYKKAIQNDEVKRK